MTERRYEHGAELGAAARLIAAADISSGGQFNVWLHKVGPHVEIVKVGPELLTAPDLGLQHAARWLMTGFPNIQIMYDGKFHEIPSKMVAAVRNLVHLKHPDGGRELVWGFTIHASNGAEVLQQVAKVKGPLKMLAVTMLTTMTEETCQRLHGKSIKEKVIELAREALNGGADGIVCSPAELAVLDEHPEFDNLERITPNIRPAWAVVPSDDQNRTREMTPKAAIVGGATRLVVGRPVSGTFAGYEEAGVSGNVDRLLTEIEAGLHELATGAA